jgi:nucleoside-diphosphate-sugar epimerase
VNQELLDAVAMFKRTTIAIDNVSPSLEFVVLQTGAKMYGLHLLENHPTGEISPPLREDMPRLEQPYHDQLFYHPQMDWMAEYSQGKKWKWCDTRPDIVIGFHPTPNFYSLGQVLAIFLTLYKAVEGDGAEVPWPGTQASWTAKSIDASSDMIARQTIHLSLTMDPKLNGTGFNVGDAKYASTWADKWQAVCNYFGLKAVGPESGKTGPEVRTYIKEHLDTWNELETKYGLQSGFADSPRVYPGFEKFLMILLDFDREYDMTKMYDVAGFKEERTPAQTYGGVFDRMRKAKIIP